MQEKNSENYFNIFKLFFKFIFIFFNFQNDFQNFKNIFKNLILYCQNHVKSAK